MSPSARPRAVPRRFMAAAVIVFYLGLLATFAISRWLDGRAARVNEAFFETNGAVMADSLIGALGDVELRMKAVAGFIRASESVTADEFADFVTEVGVVPGLEGFGFAPVLHGDPTRLDGSKVVTSTVAMFGLDSHGRKVEMPATDTYVPLVLFAPSTEVSAPYGLDLLSEPRRRGAVEAALSSGGVATTPFLHLADGYTTDGIVLVYPVLGSDGAALGVVTAPVDVMALLRAQTPAEVRGTLAFGITDLSDSARATLAENPRAGDNPVWSGVVEVGTRIWQIVTFEDEEGVPLPSGREAWLTLAGGTLISLLVAGGILLTGDRLQERRIRERLDAVIAAKDRFLATVSHELRTPLTGVIGFLEETLRPGLVTDPEATEFVRTARAEAQELADIIDDLIAATEVDPARLELTPIELDLAAEIDSIMASLPTHISGVTVAGSRGVRAWADKARTRQIIRNLIGNAARHGSPPIMITVSGDADTAFVDVADEGPGLSPEGEDGVFAPYATPERGPSTQPDPIGLGLWLSRRLARLMGGNLVIQARRPTTFRLTLPTRAAGAGWVGDAESLATIHTDLAHRPAA
jgi:signal transduction histidine kinase